MQLDEIWSLARARPAAALAAAIVIVVQVVGCESAPEESLTVPDGGRAKARADGGQRAGASKDARIADDAPAGDSQTASMIEPPDYGAAFPQERVARLDISIARANWDAMVQDLTKQLGEFGAGGGFPGSGGQPPGIGDLPSGAPPGGGFPGGGPPAELTQACQGRSAGDSCKANLFGMMLDGTCSSLGGALTCLPANGPGGPGGGRSSDLIAETPIYVECKVEAEERTWRHVGLRFKGNSSLALSWQRGIWKLPFRLQFDEFEAQYPDSKNQRFYGFKNLNLSNASMDSSLLRDKLGSEVFAKAGLPTPATAFYQLYIDHGDGPKYFGLYTAIELPSDTTFLATHFMNSDGNLYKPDGPGATFASWQQASFEKENNERAADYSDVLATFDALHASRSDARAWRARLEQHFDVETFLHWLALNTVIEDWDQYGRMSHNYYLYGNPANEGRLSWIPWDHSFAFSGTPGPGGSAASLGHAETTEDWPLIRFLLDDDVYRARYNAFLQKAVSEEYTVAAYEQRFREAHALIAPYVTGPEGERPGYTFVTADAFQKSLDELLEHVKSRAREVAAHLAQENR